jgi:hypothetical protein
MSWQLAASISGILFPVLGLLNVFLLNQVRIEVSALKIHMLEARAQDERALRSWVESEFLRKELLDDRLDALAARLERVCNNCPVISEPRHKITHGGKHAA